MYVCTYLHAQVKHFWNSRFFATRSFLLCICNLFLKFVPSRFSQYLHCTYTKIKISPILKNSKVLLHILFSSAHICKYVQVIKITFLSCDYFVKIPLRTSTNVRTKEFLLFEEVQYKSRGACCLGCTTVLLRGQLQNFYQKNLLIFIQRLYKKVNYLQVFFVMHHLVHNENHCALYQQIKYHTTFFLREKCSIFMQPVVHSRWLVHPKQHAPLQSLVFKILYSIHFCSPFGLAEYIECLIPTLLEFVLTVLCLNLNYHIDHCLLTLQACKLRTTINNQFQIFSKRTYLTYILPYPGLTVGYTHTVANSSQETNTCSTIAQAIYIQMPNTTFYFIANPKTQPPCGYFQALGVQICVCYSL